MPTISLNPAARRCSGVMSSARSREVYHLLPKNLICLHWDYASNVSSERLTRLANSGAEHLYVCPGVQGWNQLINKYHEAYENISRMARYGHECHAMGLLNTDWGDYGHINHPDFSRIGYDLRRGVLLECRHSAGGRKSTARFPCWNLVMLPENSFPVLDLLCIRCVSVAHCRYGTGSTRTASGQRRGCRTAPLLRGRRCGCSKCVNRRALRRSVRESRAPSARRNRPMIYAYLLAADGLKVLNRLLLFLRASLLSEGTLPEKEDCFGTRRRSRTVAAQL